MYCLWSSRECLQAGRGGKSHKNTPPTAAHFASCLVRIRTPPSAAHLAFRGSKRQPPLLAAYCYIVSSHNQLVLNTVVIICYSQKCLEVIYYLLSFDDSQ
jgi:hypothetical protein